MASPSKTIFLVSGVNKGIGRAFLEALLLTPNTIAIGTVRNVKSAEAEELKLVTPATGSELILIPMEMAEPDTIFQSISALKVDHIDVVISNAAICRMQHSMAELPLDEVLEHFKVNTIGSLALWKASRSLLAKSLNPKFVFITSVAGSIGIQASFPFNGTPYNVSKAAVNAIATRLAVEEKDKSIILLISPGAVKTPMTEGSNKLDLDIIKMMTENGLQVITAQESASNVLSVIESATHRESGVFIDATTRETVPW